MRAQSAYFITFGRCLQPLILVYWQQLTFTAFSLRSLLRVLPALCGEAALLDRCK